MSCERCVTAEKRLEADHRGYIASRRVLVEYIERLEAENAKLKASQNRA